MPKLLTRISNLMLAIWAWMISIEYWNLRLCVLVGALLLASCKVQEPPVALPYGPVISVDGDLIEVAHEVINKQKGSQIAAWYYVPGHRFVKGNIFPDFTRYINPTPGYSPQSSRIKPEIK